MFAENFYFILVKKIQFTQQYINIFTFVCCILLSLSVDFITEKKLSCTFKAELATQHFFFHLENFKN